jgi:hypothetical protein
MSEGAVMLRVTEVCRNVTGPVCACQALGIIPEEGRLLAMLFNYYSELQIVTEQRYSERLLTETDSRRAWCAV